jgi:hypothetical protein
MQVSGYGLPRIQLPRTRVNKGIKEGPEPREMPRSLMLTSISEVAELARFEPVQHQLEGAGLDTRPP